MNALTFPIVEWGDADALVDAIRASTDAIPKEIFVRIRAPFEELTTTAMTARATWLGAKVGRNFYHHEGRYRFVTPEEHQPELAVSDYGCDPVWEFGVLKAPKYFSFFQDAPLAAFHPNHRTKWRAHEMLHGAVGFFWRPSMSRFEAYLGARLNELLPVAHWYYFDEIDRRRCPEHADRIPSQLCVACDRITPYWKRPIEKTDALALATRGFEHVNRELEAIEMAIDSGRDVEVLYENGLNPSTDGIAYMRAHWSRLTSYAVGTWAERFLFVGVDYFQALDPFIAHVRNVARAFVSGDISSEGSFNLKQARRELQDVLYRAMLIAEFDEAFEDAAEPIFVAAETWLASGTDVTAVASIRQELSAISNTLEKDGIFFHDVELVNEGLRSVSDDDAKEVESFTQSEQFWARGTLAERYASFAKIASWGTTAMVSMLPRIDLEGERFGAVTDVLPELQTGRLRTNDTTRQIDPTTYGYHFNGTFRLIDKTAAVDAIFAAIEDEDLDFNQLDVSLLIDAIETGLVFWFPEVRRAVRSETSDE